MEKTKQKVIVGGLVGVMGGLVLGATMDLIDSPTKKARVIEEKDMPKTIKVYNDSSTANQILVEDPDNSGEYIPLSKYLKRDFKNKYERNLERARIKLSVSQGEGK